MAIYGALGEGFTQKYGTRPGEYLSRGSATVTGTLTITVPLPIRTVTFAMATLNGTTIAASGLGVSLVQVGSISNNTFLISVWMPTSSSNPTLIASTSAVSVTWCAWGTL